MGEPNQDDDRAESPKIDPEVALDEDAPGQVRKVFIALMFAASGICLIPRQYASAAILAVLGAVVTALHLRAARSGK